MDPTGMMIIVIKIRFWIISRRNQNTDDRIRWLNENNVQLYGS